MVVEYILLHSNQLSHTKNEVYDGLQVCNFNRVCVLVIAYDPTKSFTRCDQLCVSHSYLGFFIHRLKVEVYNK